MIGANLFRSYNVYVRGLGLNFFVIASLILHDAEILVPAAGRVSSL